MVVIGLIWQSGCYPAKDQFMVANANMVSIRQGITFATHQLLSIHKHASRAALVIENVLVMLVSEQSVMARGQTIVEIDMAVTCSSQMCFFLFQEHLAWLTAGWASNDKVGCDKRFCFYGRQ